MMAETGVSADLKTNAQGPLSAEGDQGKMRQHSLVDQIAADRYLKSAFAVTRTDRGLRFAKFKAGGSV